MNLNQRWQRWAASRKQKGRPDSNSPGGLPMRSISFDIFGPIPQIGRPEPMQSTDSRFAPIVGDIASHWLEELGITSERKLLLDTIPIPVVGYKPSKRRSEIAGSAGYGHCASRTTFRRFQQKISQSDFTSGTYCTIDEV